MERILRVVQPEGMVAGQFDMDLENEDIFARIEALRRKDLEVGGDFIEHFSGLISFFTKRFAMEERLAAEAGLEFSAHTHNHDQHLSLFNRALEGMKRGKMDAPSFLRYADYWFEHHINKFDKPFARRLEALSLPRINAGGESLRLSA